MDFTKRRGKSHVSHSLTASVSMAPCKTGQPDSTVTNVKSTFSVERTSAILPSTQEGKAFVVPATCPGKQEHLTVWERSSILFLLQQRWAATTSQVPVLSCFDPEEEKSEEKRDFFMLYVSRGSLSNCQTVQTANLNSNQNDYVAS